METIKVNMNPNPLDVQTIHASQNDGEARQWEFELHNNGELIDTSEITEQLFFKSYKGGTEQILPENGSVPTTSPIIADIKYPQGLLNDQEFLYRESPTEEDGYAKIETIYGNTLVWNQLVQNGDFASSNAWFSSMGTRTFSNNELTYQPTSIGNVYYENQVLQRGFNVPTNHVLFLHCETYAPYDNGFYMSVRTNNAGQANVGITNVRPTPNSWSSFSKITKPTNTVTDIAFYWSMDTRYTTDDTVKLRNVYIIDLTMLFGTEKAEEILAMGQTDGIAYFRSLFPLPYYQYDSGSLLSFRGEGLKTVGKNLLMPTATFPQTINGITYTLNADGSITANGTAGSGGSTLIYWEKNTYGGKLLADGTYKLSGIIGGSSSTYTIRTNGFGGVSISSGESTFTITDSLPQTNVIIVISSNVTVNNVVFKPMIRRADVKDNTYQKHFSSTLSLPISTYFPTGMKSAGSVYDELTPTKAITRIGAVDLGSLTWTYDTTYLRFIASISGAKTPSNNDTKANIVNSLYSTVTSNETSFPDYNKVIGLSRGGNIQVRDTSYTDATAFKTAMNGVYLYYELATPTETSFTTASLVTENAEIPLSNEDGTLIGKCTEELSSEPGFIDAKIKLTDGDGTCYSNKIQLHVERKP